MHQQDRHFYRIVSSSSLSDIGNSQHIYSSNPKPCTKEARSPRKSRLNLHHSVAQLYLRTLPSVASLHEEPSKTSKRKVKRSVMVSNSLTVNHASSDVIAKQPAMADPTTTFLHSQSGQFPALSSDGSASSSGSVSSASHHIDSNRLRLLFASSMSNMYKDEVPLYGDLISIISDVNGNAITKDPSRITDDEISRLNVERHGAIRVGKPAELEILSRIFNVMGMRPVGYYDLWKHAGLPIHATAFRPVGETELMKNPFRIFCSLLRIELIQDPQTKALAEKLLENRQIASPRCLELLAQLERSIETVAAHKLDTDGNPTHQDYFDHGSHIVSVSREEVLEFIDECIKIFKWHSDTQVSKSDYDKLKEAHPLFADIVGFRGPHINHLTPRTLDIDQVQREMLKRGIDAKDIVEGPPTRAYPIYLRQTSFHALCEQITFVDANDSTSKIQGHHTARFGEIEQRGQALTRKGASLYDDIVRIVNTQQAKIKALESRKLTLTEYNANRQRAFDQHFPDSETEIRKQQLGFYRYRLASSIPEAVDEKAHAQGNHQCVLDRLIEKEMVVFEPIIYEDFLPASAAGIFLSNLATVGPSSSSDSSSTPQQSQKELEAIQKKQEADARARLEHAVGGSILDPFELYETEQTKTLEHLAQQLGITLQELL